MTKPVQVSDAAYAKVEIFAKDNDLSKQEAATQIILKNADLLASTAIKENSNCHWDLYSLNVASGEKDFSCPIKRQRPDLRANDQMPILNAEYCKTCPMMKRNLMMFKFEMRLKDLQNRPNIKPAAPSSVPAAIASEMAKDTAEPVQLRSSPSRVQELKGLGAVDCDNCNEIFYASTVDELLDDLVKHKRDTHGTDRISDNEATKIRWAREKLEKEVPA